MKLTIYLFKQSVNAYEDATRADKLIGDSAFEEVKLRAVEFEGRGYLQREKRKPPGWFEFIRPYIDIERPKEIINQSNSFLLLLKAQGRIFGITTGYGFTAIDMTKIEPDFGLRVTLNAVAKEKLRSVQARNIDANMIQRQVVATLDSGVSVFEVDFFQQLLARMEGKPEDIDLGTRIEGADAVGLTSHVGFPELADKCSQLLKAFRARAWTKKFPGINNIRPINDAQLIAQLDHKLCEAIDQRISDKLYFALPDISQLGSVQSIVLRHPGAQKTTTDVLDREAIYDFLDKKEINTVDPSAANIVATTEANGGGNAVTGYLSLHKCATFETKLSGKTYVLTLGKWYLIAQGYVNKINQELSSRADSLVIDDASYLPTIAAKEAEGEYNERAAQEMGYVCLDRKCPQIDGASRIEVSDLLTPSGDFIHVKRKTASATLSHLFGQGTVSAECLLEHQPIREFVRDQLPAAQKNMMKAKSLRPEKFRIVYAITAPQNRQLPADLPFFSKVNLLFHLKTIERLGFTTGLYHVPITD